MTWQVYLDNNATTQMAPEVLEAMKPYQSENYGNPSSLHRLGREAKKGIGKAREQVASLIGADPSEIIFTSGGTESDNAALFAALQSDSKKNHILTTAVEHPAVLDFVAFCERRGYRAKRLGVAQDGSLNTEAFETNITDQTVIASVMMANNETGVVFPVEQLAAVAKARGVLFHADAVQALGKIPVDVRKIPADYLAFSGHKIHGPKGTGALFIRNGVPFSPLLYGGSQEQGRRSGTENVAGIIGFGTACALAAERLKNDVARMCQLRDKLENGILAACANAKVNGNPESRLPNTSNISFEGVEGDSLLLRLDEEGICVSTGSACSSGLREPSRILRAMKLPGPRLHSAIRFSLSFFTTQEEVDYTINAVAEIIRKSKTSASHKS